MKSDIISELSKVFGSKVSFDDIERQLNSHDVSVIPSPILKSLKTIPDAVIRIENEDDIKSALRIARKYKIPITPRGRGTAGYGGAVPINKGLVLNFTWYRGVLNINRDAKLVTVEPGIIWKDLEHELQRYFLGLKMYPTSAPGSSVGGFFAMGGSGIGSYENGSFLNSVHSIDIINLDGTIKTIVGDDLKYYYGLEGTTGIISKITVRIDEKQRYEPIGLGVPTPEALQSFLQDLAIKKLPIWHIGFLVPEFMKLKNLAVKTQPVEVLRTIKGFPDKGEKVFLKGLEVFHLPLPEDLYFIMVVVRSEAYETVHDSVVNLAKKLGGKELKHILTTHQWEERFYPLSFKRLGPTLVPSEGIVEINRLAEALSKIETAIKGIAIEGMMTTSNNVVLLAFNLGDERSWGYPLRFSRSLKFLRILKKFGGCTYGTGLFFTSEAKNIFGEEFIKELKVFKTKKDPHNLLNPGKVLFPKAKILWWAIFMANFPVVRSFLPLMEVIARGLHGRRRAKYLPDELINEAFSCAQCSYCQQVCTIFEGRRLEKASPRGKFYYLTQLAKGKVKLTDELASEFLLCTTCFRCEQPGICQLNISIESLFEEMRGILINNKQCATFPAFHLMAGGIVTGKNIWAHDPNHRVDWVPEEIKPFIGKKADVGYWGGCTASYLMPNITSGATRILKVGGVDFTLLGNDEGCCGAPMMMAGLWDVFKETMKKNIRKIHKYGIKKLIISCPACYTSMAYFYPIFLEKMSDENPQLKEIWEKMEFIHISKIIDELVSEGKIEFTQSIKKIVTWHDSCHLFRPSDYYENPRDVLKAIPGLNFREMKHHRENSLCCGSVITRMGNWEASDRLAKIRLEEAHDIGAEEIYTTCPCCEFQLRIGADKNNINIPIKDLTDIVLVGMGETPTKDPTPIVLHIWNHVYEPAILLMTPRGLNKMISLMKPEIIEAMPTALKTILKGLKVTRLSYIMSPIFNFLNMLPWGIPKMYEYMLSKMMPNMLLDIQEYMFLSIPGLNQYPQMKNRMKRVLPYTLKKIFPTMLPKMIPELKSTVLKAIQDYMNSKLEPIGSFRTKVSPTVSVDQ